MAKWRPVVGGRAMLEGKVVLTVARYDDPWGRGDAWDVVGVDATIKRVDTRMLAEHPDDARHRRLLAAAREVVNYGYDLKSVTRLQSAVQACDDAESTDA